MSALGTGFGLEDVAIATMPATPGGTPSWVDVPSVESAAYKMNVGEVEQYGDDVLQGVFYHSQRGQITLKGNKIAMAVLEMLSGNEAEFVGTGATRTQEILIGTAAELLPPRVMVRATVPFRNEDGSVGKLTTYFFACEAKTLWENMPGGERAKMVENQIQLNTFASNRDETGTSLGTGISAHGKLVLPAPEVVVPDP